MCVCYLTLQEEEHQHADEIPIGAAPPSALSQRFFRLRIVTTEQPDRQRGGERGVRESVEERPRETIHGTINLTDQIILGYKSSWWTHFLCRNSPAATATGLCAE